MVHGTFSLHPQGTSVGMAELRYWQLPFQHGSVNIQQNLQMTDTDMREYRLNRCYGVRGLVLDSN